MDFRLQPELVGRSDKISGAGFGKRVFCGYGHNSIFVCHQETGARHGIGGSNVKDFKIAEWVRMFRRLLPRCLRRPQEGFAGGFGLQVSGKSASPNEREDGEEFGVHGSSFRNRTYSSRKIFRPNQSSLINVHSSRFSMADDTDVCHDSGLRGSQKM